MLPDIKWPDEFPLLKTERLCIDQVRERDSHGIYRCFSHPETMKYLGEPLDDPLSVAGIVEDYRTGFQAGSSIIWAIRLHDGEFLGTAGFEQFSFLDLTAELGFTLLHEHQGMGYMGEALTAILCFGFNILDINRIQATVVPANHPALRVLQKLGFSAEGLLRQSVVMGGSIHDQTVLSMLREEWRKDV